MVWRRAPVGWPCAVRRVAPAFAVPDPERKVARVAVRSPLDQDRGRAGHGPAEAPAFARGRVPVSAPAVVWLALAVALGVGAIIQLGRSVRRDDAVGDLLGLLM